MRWRILALAVSIAATACGGGSGDDDDDIVDAGGDVDARVATIDGPCPLADRVGRFGIVSNDGYSLVDGFVADKVEPNTVLQLEYEEGGCRFLRKINPFCDPPCTGGTTCDLAETCVSAPVKLSAGTVTVEGLVGDVAMEPNEITKDYQDSSLPNPPFEVGALLELNAAGADTAAFTLDGRGVEPLVLADDMWTMVEGQPMDIEWTPSDGPGEIYVILNVDLHGNSPVTMHCTFEDTGSATIPQALVDRLISYGVTVGFATANAHRRTVDRVEIDQGCVDLTVHSHVRPQLLLEQP